MTTRVRDLIDLANTIPLATIFSEFYGIEVPETDEFSRSYKTYCPFQFDHPNPIDRNFRYYPTTNSSYCFEVHGLLTPVRLTAMARDRGTKEAAMFLLQHYGKLRPKKWEDRWQELVLAREARTSVRMQSACEALHIWIEATGFSTHQFEPWFQEQLRDSLEDLEREDKVLVDPKLWLTQAKQGLKVAVSEASRKGSSL